MSLLGRNSSSNRPKNTSNEHYSCHSAPDLNAAPTEEGRLTPLSDNSRDQFNHSSSSSGPSVSPPLSSRVSSPYTHRLLHSSILSLDDLNKCHSSPSQQHHPVQTPPTDQKKSKGFFDRMRTSSNRSSASEAKLSPLSSIGSRPNITRRITSQDTVQPTSRSIPNTNFTAEKQSAGNEVPNRLSGQSYETNQQQEHSSLRSSIWHRNSQSVSQISLISQEDPNSASVNSQNLDLSSQQHYLTPLNQHPQLEAQHMAPSSNSIISRKAADTKLSLQLQQETRDHSSPNYNRSQFSNHQPSAPGMSPSFQANQAQNNRSASQKEAYNSTQNEQRQNAAAPQVQERDINDNYKELVTKYKKVKGLYFEKTAQVEQLQNTLANQRLSQSRTSLDDSEYMTRFQRLEGAITNLAFNIRKDWQHVPGWLSQSVNHDAIKIGKHEMTAVGRAVITKFLVDEIFDQIFHPGLPMELSRSLKSIEKNIRKFSPAHNNHEESEALTARVMQWRLTTLDGLKDLLAPIESEEIKNQFIDRCTNNLTGLITSFLHEPNPPGIKDSAHIIVELAVSISSNLPLESRDLCISYPMPGNMLQPAIMKVENPIPSLGDTIADIDENEGTQSGDKDESGNDNEDSSQKVRFSGFISVEVRGRQILYKAPVWTMAKN